MRLNLSVQVHLRSNMRLPMGRRGAHRRRQLPPDAAHAILRAHRRLSTRATVDIPRNQPDPPSDQPLHG